jgi:hypothetical protein
VNPLRQQDVHSAAAQRDAGVRYGDPPARQRADRAVTASKVGRVVLALLGHLARRLGGRDHEDVVNSAVLAQFCDANAGRPAVAGGLYEAGQRCPVRANTDSSE